MNISAWLGAVIVGFGAWWGTGVDDVLALGLLLRRARPAERFPMLAGNALAVILILALASAVALGGLRLAPEFLATRVFGLPIENLAGIVPIGIGLWTLIQFVRGEDDDDETPDRARFAFALGFQVYAVNAIEDFVVHLGILSALHDAVIAYWIGNLIGEATSIAAAGWLANHLRARRGLTVFAALVIIGIGLILLLNG